MQKVTIKIDGSEQEVNVLRVFHGRNPATQRYGVYLTYTNKIGKQRHVRLFCEEEYLEGPARELAQNIREGKITDLTGYLTERG
ncbi:MAG: hypothetical protein K2O91_02750 [Lachnospiraceae bacterium]|nr:hypothetical protein [Lachnospiraceae bacterium]